jgi:hypothetical protein
MKKIRVWVSRDDAPGNEHVLWIKRPIYFCEESAYGDSGGVFSGTYLEIKPAGLKRGECKEFVLTPVKKGRKS